MSWAISNYTAHHHQQQQLTYLLGKHARAPELARHKRGTSNTNGGTKGRQTSSRVDKADARRGKGSNTEQETHKDTGSQLVTQGPHEETHQNSRTNTNNVGRPHILLGDTNVVTDFAQKGGNGEPNEKGNEETPPRTVKGTHVGTTERAELDLGSTVVLVGVDGNAVLRVLLPFSLKMRERE